MSMAHAKMQWADSLEGGQLRIYRMITSEVNDLLSAELLFPVVVATAVDIRSGLPGVGTATTQAFWHEGRCCLQEKGGEGWHVVQRSVNALAEPSKHKIKICHSCNRH